MNVIRLEDLENVDLADLEKDIEQAYEKLGKLKSHPYFMSDDISEKIGRLRAKYEHKKGKTVVIFGRGSAFDYLARTRLDGSDPLGSIEGEVVGVEADAVRVFVERLDRVKRVYFVDIVE